MTVNMPYGDSDDIIGEYVTFTKVYNEQLEILGRTEDAIKETIRICRDKKVLVEYLKSREKEVIDMLVTLFDEEHIMKAHDKTVFEDGVSQGISQGKLETLLDLVNEGTLEMATAAKKANMTLEEFSELLKTH